MNFPIYPIYRGLIYTSLARTSDELYSQITGTQMKLPASIMIIYFLASLFVYEPLREIDRFRHPRYDHKKYAWRFWWLRVLRYFLTTSMIHGALRITVKHSWWPETKLLPAPQTQFSAISIVLWTLWVALIGEYVHQLLTYTPKPIPSRLITSEPVHSQIQHI